MRLRIEPPGARRESYSGAARGEASPAGRVLDLAVERQELERWC